MSCSSLRLGRILSVLVLLVVAMPPLTAAAAPPANSQFERTWERTDRPVAERQVNRTWMWGPEAFTGTMKESFFEAPGGMRAVQYFDKSRMEISEVGEDPSSIWYVTNGLLVTEMMSGAMQAGLNSYQQRDAANINVAGDADDSTGPTYATFGLVAHHPLGLPGATITSRLFRDGGIDDVPSFSAYGVTADEYVIETNHRVASVFWEFMNLMALVYENGSMITAQLFQNPFYATGLPVTEAYWSVVKVGGVANDVLIQCFERRCLTYTPSNSQGWQVEAGNVGQHYYAWRYGTTPPTTPAPPSTPPPVAGPQPLPDIILDPYWLDPEAAVYRAWTELGRATNGDPVFELMLASAHGLPGAYGIDTAEVGEWNHDTRGFYPWLVHFIRFSQFHKRSAHTRQQVMAMIYEPNSNIARRVREFERNLEHDYPGDGPYAYFFFMFLPQNLPIYLTPMAREAAGRVWDRMELGYRSARYSDPTLSGFADYLARRGYEPPLGFSP
jgi:hypothetical protein